MRIHENTINKIVSILSDDEINMINIKLDTKAEKDVIHELTVDYCMFIDKEENGTYNIRKFNCMKGEIE